MRPSPPPSPCSQHSTGCNRDRASFGPYTTRLIACVTVHPVRNAQYNRKQPCAAISETRAAQASLGQAHSSCLPGFTAHIIGFVHAPKGIRLHSLAAVGCSSATSSRSTRPNHCSPDSATAGSTVRSSACSPYAHAERLKRVPCGPCAVCCDLDSDIITGKAGRNSSQLRAS